MNGLLALAIATWIVGLAQGAYYWERAHENRDLKQIVRGDGGRGQ